MKQFLALLEDIYKNGKDRSDRTGVGRRGIFGTRMEFDLSEGFPLVTSRFTSFKNIKEELLWFISGSYDNKDLKARGINFWNAWEVTEEDVVVRLGNVYSVGSDKEHFFPGSIGPMYGYAWRNAPSEFKGKTSGDFLDYFHENVSYLDSPDLIERYAPDVQIKAFKKMGYIANGTKADMYQQVINILKRMSKYPPRNINELFVTALFDLGLTGTDQLWESIQLLKKDPYSARNCVTAWIPQWVPYRNGSYADNVINGKGVLAPCHAFFQFFVEPDEEGKPSTVSLQLLQRSSDSAVGKPYNIASYSLLLMMVAREVGLKPGRFIWVGGDTHIYLNQFASVEEQLTRETHALPTVAFDKNAPESIFLIEPDQIQCIGYKHSGKLEYPVAS